MTHGAADRRQSTSAPSCAARRSSFAQRSGRLRTRRADAPRSLHRRRTRAHLVAPASRISFVHWAGAHRRAVRLGAAGRARSARSTRRATALPTWSAACSSSRPRPSPSASRPGSGCSARRATTTIASSLAHLVALRRSRAAASAGRLDSDGDGIPDDVDQCPDEPRGPRRLRRRRRLPRSRQRRRRHPRRARPLPQRARGPRRLPGRRRLPRTRQRRRRHPRRARPLPQRARGPRRLPGRRRLPRPRQRRRRHPRRARQLPQRAGDAATAIDDDDGCPDSGGTRDLHRRRRRLQMPTRCCTSSLGRRELTVAHRAVLDRVADTLKRLLAHCPAPTHRGSRGRQRGGAQSRSGACRRRAPSACVRYLIVARRRAPIGCRRSATATQRPVDSREDPGRSSARTAGSNSSSWSSER